MPLSSRPSRRKPTLKAVEVYSDNATKTTSFTLPQTLAALLVCATIACFFYGPNIGTSSLLSASSTTPASTNYFNCTPPLAELPETDLPYETATLWDLPKMREYIQREQPGIQKYYQQQDKLEEYIRKKFGRKPSVLELGGNNGWFADPLFPIMMAHEWPAIIVEALPHQYARLVRNYGEKYKGCLWSGLQLINIALLEEKKQVSMSFQNTNGWQRGGGSVLRHQNEDGWQTMMVPGDTLEAVLKGISYTDIDLIQIDIEGLDEAMLKQVDKIMDTIYPRMVCIETCNTNYCDEFFAKHGFQEFRAPGEICGTRDFS